MKKTENIIVRLTTEEKNLLQQEAEKNLLTISAHIRRRLFLKNGI
jgi:hypothetical protein